MAYLYTHFFVYQFQIKYTKYWTFLKVQTTLKLLQYASYYNITTNTFEVIFV